MDDVGSVGLRVILGVLLAAHGAAKLTPAIGPGLTGTAVELAQDGLRGGRTAALAAGVTQVAAAVLLLLGAATPLACAMSLGVMTTALLTRLAYGFWAHRGGVEYPLVLCGLAAALALAGPGPLSIDRALGLGYWPAWAGPAGAVAGVATGGVVWMLLRRPRHETAT